MARFVFLVLATALVCPATTPREAVDSLEETQIQKALEAMRTHFLSPQQLEEASQRALLQGLLERFPAGFAIVDSKEAAGEQKKIPFLSEILDGRAGYLRPGTLDSAALAQMDSSLENFREKSLGALILDLRAIPVEKGFEGSAGFAKRFCPKGAILFTVEKANPKQERIVSNDQAPDFEGILVVLVDSDTKGPAEVLAATLRDNAKAMVVGDRTAGAAVEFADFPIGGESSVRVATSQVLMPKSGALFPKGVEPDIVVQLARETRDRIFEKSATEGVSRFTLDEETPRMNEAALVANTNPEIGEEPEQKSDPSLRDTVLQRALDLVTAIGFYKK